MAEAIETFGASIPPLAGDQIRAREKLYKGGEELRSIGDIQAINSNAAWVKLRSSVNKVTAGDTAIDNAAKDPANVSTILNGLSSIEAETFILTGGRAVVSKDQETNLYGGREVKGINFDPNYNPDFSYNNYNQSLGIRPMPGITGLKVAAKNTYGTLMQAEVDFVVWTLEDLERAELLFLRPGYTCLLEWGHSVYIDNEGQIQFASNASTVPDDIFFTAQSTAKIEQEVQTLRNNAYGNYDAMFGFITNFNWSFRKDGGYDCSIKVVSRGAILESLSMGKTSDATEAEKKKKEKDKEERKSIYHFVFKRLEEKTSGEQFDGKQWLSNEGQASDIASKLLPFKVFRTKQELAGEGFLGTDKGIELQYISLRTLLDIFNKFISPKNITKGETLLAFDLEYGEKFLTFPQHFSVDPLIAIPPKIPSGLEKAGFEKGEKYSVTSNNIHKNVEAYVGDKKDDILNIMVSTYFVKKCVNSVIDGAQEEGVGVYDFMKEVLSGINNAFGEVNDLGMFYVHNSPGIYKIVDRKNTDSRRNLQEVSITGLSSTVVDISLSSKLSSQTSAQISIAAQGNSGNYKDNVEAILKWNQGAIDRHIETKSQTPEEKEDAAKAAESAKKRRKKYIEDLGDVWDRFNNGPPNASWAQRVGTDLQFDAEDWNRLRAESIAELNRFYKTREDGQPIKGVIPVELSLKMLGVTGFKIGTAFTISRGLLPSKYDKYAYIITGVDHEIGTDNKWYTNVKTQFYATQ